LIRLNDRFTCKSGHWANIALTVALVEGREPNDVLRLACAAGLLATTSMGAQTPLPMRYEVNAYAK